MAVAGWVARIALAWRLVMSSRVTDEEIKALLLRMDCGMTTAADVDLLRRLIDQIIAEVTGNAD
jgi:hypothetical protein